MHFFLLACAFSFRCLIFYPLLKCSKYLNLCTCLNLSDSKLGYFLLLKTIHSLFLQLMFSPHLQLSFTTLSKSPCSLTSVSASVIYRSSIVEITPALINHGGVSRFVKIDLVKKLITYAEKTHRCITLFWRIK